MRMGRVPRGHDCAPPGSGGRRANTWCMACDACMRNIRTQRTPASPERRKGRWRTRAGPSNRIGTRQRPLPLARGPRAGGGRGETN